MHVRRNLRLLFVLLITASTLVVGHGLASATADLDDALAGSDAREEVRVAPPADGITVIATDSNVWRGGGSDDPRATAELVAVRPNGTLLYANGSHDRYWDVDPIPGTDATVEYAFSDHLEGAACPTTYELAEYRVDRATWERYLEARSTTACTRNGVERVDLRTGETTVVWTHVTPGKAATRYHDVDRLDAERLVVADIYLDRVFVVDVPTGEIEWTWRAEGAFSTDTAGPYPKDWTHLNDVEVLEDGRVMVSLRNLDQVVFLDRSGVVEGWTLGAEDDHAVLYEQHNPDYLDDEEGGPAVLVADSENNRVVEYQRRDGAWTRTWRWRDADLQWPRDADRLPDGHTLITDSNGDRVVEVDESGTVVWSLEVAFPYEAERLPTADESDGGPSASHADLRSRTTDDPLVSIKHRLPGKYLNAALYPTPAWMGPFELFSLVLALLAAIAWGGLELRWRLAGPGPPRP